MAHLKLPRIGAVACTAPLVGPWQPLICFPERSGRRQAQQQQVRANASQRQGGNADDGVESTSFSGTSALRRGFQPQARPVQQQGGNGAAALDVDGKMVFGNGDMSEDAWRQIDSKLNRYPGYRTFTAIGVPDGGAFRAAMVEAVESVVGPVHVECVAERPSKQGKYTSVKVGPVIVKTPEQVIEIFAVMKQDPRLKWFM